MKILKNLDNIPKITKKLKFTSRNKIKSKFLDLKSGIKLGLAFALVIVLFMIPITISLQYFNNATNEFNNTNEVSIPEIYLVTSVYSDLKYIEKNLYASTLTNNLTKKADYSQLSNDIHTGIVNNLNQLNILLKGNDIIEQLLLLLSDEKVVRDEVMNSEYKSDAERLIFNSYDPLVIKINKALDELAGSINNDISNNVTMAINNSNKAVLITIIVTSIAIASSVLITWLITNSIIKPINEIEKLATSLSEGNLAYRINYSSNNEFGKLSNSIQTSILVLSSYINEVDEIMSEISKGNLTTKIKLKFKGDFQRLEQSISSTINNLSEALWQTNKASKEVLSGAEQIASGAQYLSEGSLEQASIVEELSATIEELSERIKSNAEMSSSANNSFYNMSNEISVSNNYMNDMLKAMEEINYKSQEIGRIIKIIEDIAFQTNILALNAAVEAARAGSAGKGFAVVADEVRNLARRSAEAANSTTKLIEDTLKAVSSGSNILEETANSLANVVISSKDINNIINEIVKATKNQTQSVEQIVLGVNQISSFVQKNASIADEDAAISEELSAQSQELYLLTSKFKLNKSLLEA